MLKPIQIFFVHAKDFPDCEIAKSEIVKAISDSGVVCDLKLFDSEERVTVNIAIANGIDDIPACVVGNKDNVFQTEDITKDNISAAILKVKSQGAIS